VWSELLIENMSSVSKVEVRTLYLLRLPLVLEKRLILALFTVCKEASAPLFQNDLCILLVPHDTRVYKTGWHMCLQEQLMYRLEDIKCSYFSVLPVGFWRDMISV
jgi:hypothetical protein